MSLKKIKRKKESFLIKYQDEILLAFNGLLQLHYIQAFKSSFTENLYGLKREGKNKNITLWADIVVRPYLQRKLKNLFENCREDLADGIQCSNSNLTRLRNIFVNVYPILHLAIEVTNIYFLLLFTLQKMRHHNLTSFLLKYQLVTAPPFHNQHISSNGIDIFSFKSILTYFANIVSFSFETGSFLLQFLDNWYNKSDVKKMAVFESIPPPPPPFSQEMRSSKGCCPLCRKRLGNGKTLAPISGLLFCYLCIVSYIREHSKCPVTKLPLQEKDLVRIFD